MRSTAWTSTGWMLALLLAGATPAAAQASGGQPAVTLQTTGTFAQGGEFFGTLTLNRFEERSNQIVAIGLVQGVLRRGSRTVGTALAGEIEWPVVVSAGGVTLANGRAPGAFQLTPVRWSANAAPRSRIVPVQAAGCPVVQVALGPVTIDLLGVQVTLSSVALDLTGASGTPLGDLVCAVSDLLGNVAGLVNVLNDILGLLTGLLGGLTGGLGGAAPAAR